MGGWEDSGRTRKGQFSLYSPLWGQCGSEMGSKAEQGGAWEGRLFGRMWKEGVVCRWCRVDLWGEQMTALPSSISSTTRRGSSGSIFIWNLSTTCRGTGLTSLPGAVLSLPLSLSLQFMQLCIVCEN